MSQPSEGASFDLERVIEVLDRHRVEFILVGGPAARLYGANHVTGNPGCLARRTAENLDRLGEAMRELNARLRTEGLTDAQAAALPVIIDHHTLGGIATSTWMTDAGGFDVLNDIAVGDGRRLTYDEVARTAVDFEVAGATVIVAHLDVIIASKEWANRPGDLLALRELQRRRNLGKAKTVGFWFAVLLELPLLVVLTLFALGVLPADAFDAWRTPIVIVMLLLFVVAALASEEVIPWTERSWARWRSPRVVGALTGMVFQAFSLVALVAQLFDPPATEETQIAIQQTQATILLNQGAFQDNQAVFQKTLEDQSAATSKQLGALNENVEDLGDNIAAVAGGEPSDPRAKIARLTGKWSVEGFVDTIFERATDITELYLESGMEATTLHKGASAILFGFQGDMNGDPIALLQTFEANGFNLDEDLVDGYLLASYSELLPTMFESELAPDNYTGGYWGGQFTGPLMFWIVERAAYYGPSDQDREVLEYLISQGADCTVSRAYLEYQRDMWQSIAGEDPSNDGFSTTSERELYALLGEC